MKFYRLFFFALWLFSSCNLSEDQVIINSKSIVKYRNSVRKEEARHLGMFLLQQGYFNAFDNRTVYLQKEKEAFVVTFILPQKLSKEDLEDIAAGFVVWQGWIQEKVFQHNATQVVLANEQLQTLHKIKKLVPATPDTTINTFDP